MRMADKRGIARGFWTVFRLKNTLKMTLGRWYIYMKYLANNGPFLSSSFFTRIKS
jgi:hypothetical protein